MAKVAATVIPEMSIDCLGSLRRSARGWRLAIGTIAAGLVATPVVKAMPDCRPAGPIGGGLRKLIREFAETRPGQSSTAPVHDFLVGVSGVPAASQASLAQRGPVHILAKGIGEGDLASDGPQGLQFEGVFARTRTFFRVPQQIRAQYRVAARTLVIGYKEGGAIELGEAVPLVGVPVYRRINHAVITPDRLLFFWGSNTGSEPDRCYVPSAS